MRSPPTQVITTTSVGSGQPRRRGERVPWVEIWNSETSSDATLDEFVDSLPSRSRQRNDKVPRCTLDHATYDEDETLMTRHPMRRIVTESCESSSLATVCVDGHHTMPDSSVESPTAKTIPMSDAMKAVIDERLSDHVWFTPVDLLGILCKKIKRQTLAGPAPVLSQVQSYVKKWRKKTDK
ncbi:hypothetical protein PHYSODRAFT_306885 [Phytophthora sojae]|uniref:Uncharacterized protein n=1 Tax=Phytophthora sojae (strain P6497) TaxID=1094619 RepID=G5ABH5_PHYSP|nr:hypothetical protein PHYSODRAFT_306885 [Phytophthora sojae]EGZ06700.1 hypothetical protein PHYSODRAFT_306885 [Phytophthora sojae]|eukprot:XP_009537464.1 hypothetical protein PHYSODRAFT_306885 [Phytophthora sojae]